MKTDCRNIQEIFNDYFDSTLSWKKRLMMKRHLAGCAACRQRYFREKKIVNLLQTLPVHLMNPEVVKRIENATGQNVTLTKNRQYASIPQWPKLAVGFATIIIVAVLLMRPVSENPSSRIDEITVRDAKQARDAAKWSLLYMSTLLKETEQKVVSDILLRDMPGTVKKSLIKSIPLLKGGE